MMLKTNQRCTAILLILAGCGKKVQPVDTFAWHIDTAPAQSAGLVDEPEVRCEFVVYSHRLLLYVTVQNVTSEPLSITGMEIVDSTFDGSLWTMMWGSDSGGAAFSLSPGEAASSPAFNVSFTSVSTGSDELAVLSGMFNLNLNKPFRVICGLNWTAPGAPEHSQSFSSETDIVISRQLLKHPAPMPSWRVK